MIRYTVEGNAEFERMLRYMSQFPKILDKYTAPAMRQTLKVARSVIIPKVPTLTGLAKSSLEEQLFGYGKTLTGVIGWKGGKGAPWYINIVEYGAKPHALNKGSKSRTASQQARFQKRQEKGRLTGAHFMIKGAGSWVTMKSHPGFSKRGFMAAGFSASQPVYNAEMQKAVQNAFNEVAR